MTLRQERTRVLVIDANPVLGQRLQEILTANSVPSLEFDQVPHYDAALEHLRYHSVDVVLVGLNQPDNMGTAGIKLLHESYPTLSVIVLLAGEDPEDIAEARLAGAVDYLRLDAVQKEIWLRAIRYAREQKEIRRCLLDAELELRRRSSTDPLTGLLNRAGIEQSLLRELHICRSESAELLVMLIDLDNFRRLNASLDYSAGDMALQNAAERIRSVVSDAEMTGRAGDDQFLVLLPRMTMEEGMIIAERIRLGIARDRIQVSGKSLMVTASIGLTTVPTDTMTISEVLALAHVALHRSKSLGKNRVCCALTGAGGRGLPKPVMVSGELLQSLLYEGSLRVASQPILRLADQKVVSREMLIRGPEGAFQQPADLFRYCFEKDILTPVDLHCLKKCVTAAREFRDGLPIHVNLMPSTLMETPTDQLIELFNDCGDRRFCVEISEQQLLNNPSHLGSTVKALQAAQIQVAMDDVGFGKNCLEGLIMLQPEIMKIDKKLIIGLGEDRNMRLALKRLLRVTEVLDTEIIAEGIEAEQDLAVLQDYGVNYGQGFYLGKPEFVGVTPATNETVGSASSKLKS